VAVDRATAGRAMLLAPAVGLVLAVLLVPVLLALDALGSPLLAAALVVALHALLTRGLHLDGLADLADGLGSYRTPEQARAVMKAPDVGPLGVAAVVLVLLVQVAALAESTAAGQGATALLVALVAARTAVTAACRWSVPPATATGLGALVAGTVKVGRAPVLIAVALLVAVLAAALDDARLGAAPVAVVAGLSVAALLRWHAVRRIGGITGDVLGALVETTAAVVLVVLALSA
jgi:adenosylcobinamide-GDP ribazoletransferase